MKAWTGGFPFPWSARFCHPALHDVTYGRANWVFLCLLGLAYLAAFWSMAVQIVGLVGKDGILPATDLMAAARQFTDARGLSAVGRVLTLPTLCWISASDTVLHVLCGSGIALALLLMLGVAPIVVLPLLWIDYLSLSVVLRDFLSFQWDSLLLETGLLAVFVAPVALLEHPRRPVDPSPPARWLLWWLLFRLTFASGVVKLASGDPTWHNLTALTFHYETQPLPTPIGWYAHHLPPMLQKISTALVLTIELAVPWLIFMGRRLRLVACGTLAGLQLLIAVTGNYTFFNLLTLALLVLLLDDGVFRSKPELAAPVRNRFGFLWRRWAPIGAAVVTLPVSASILAGQLGLPLRASALFGPLEDAVAQFRSVNAYGLFAVMTTTRPEIVVEGSSDGVSWLAYEFKYKPGDVGRGLPWVAPHQPRLDWQMWFAALSEYEREPWFERFCRRLLEGSPAVLALLAGNPFPREPPRFVRADRKSTRLNSSHRL